jgi:general secretion pathway protein H
MSDNPIRAATGRGPQQTQCLLGCPGSRGPQRIPMCWGGSAFRYAGVNLRSPLVTRHSPLSRGVTLLELLIVMALATMLLALVFPSIRSGMGTLALHSSAQRLAAAAKFARDQAIYRQKPFLLEIDAAAGTVSVLDSDGGSRSFELPPEVRVGRILPLEPDAPSQRRTFLFSPDGSSVPFQVILENPRRRVAVSTDPLTGFPQISDL